MMAKQFPAAEMKGLDIELDDVKKQQFESTQYWVRATDVEFHSFWKNYAKEAAFFKLVPKRKNRVDWKEESSIYWYVVGTVTNGQTVDLIKMQVRWVVINQTRVGFYSPMSPIANERMMEAFLSQYSSVFQNSQKVCDAQNFSPYRLE